MRVEKTNGWGQVRWRMPRSRHEQQLGTAGSNECVRFAGKETTGAERVNTSKVRRGLEQGGKRQGKETQGCSPRSREGTTKKRIAVQKAAIWLMRHSSGWWQILPPRTMQLDVNPNHLRSYIPHGCSCATRFDTRNRRTRAATLLCSVLTAFRSLRCCFIGEVPLR